MPMKALRLRSLARACMASGLAAPSGCSCCCCCCGSVASFLCLIDVVPLPLAGADFAAVAAAGLAAAGLLLLLSFELSPGCCWTPDSAYCSCEACKLSPLAGASSATRDDTANSIDEHRTALQLLMAQLTSSCGLFANAPGSYCSTGRQKLMSMAVLARQNSMHVSGSV